MDRGTVRKDVEFHFHNKVQKLVHLVGFIIAKSYLPILLLHILFSSYMFRLMLAIIRENKMRAKTLLTTVGAERLYNKQHLVSRMHYKSCIKTSRIKMLTTSYSISKTHVHINMQYNLCIRIQTPTFFLESLYEAIPGKSGLSYAPFT
jgi:hypothetical protein